MCGQGYKYKGVGTLTHKPNKFSEIPSIPEEELRLRMFCESPSPKSLITQFSNFIALPQVSLFGFVSITQY